MKASYVLPIAAVALLGAGALYAPLNPLDPEIVSVCTERNPIYAKKGTEYVNALGIDLTGEEVKAAYNEVASDFKSIYDADADEDIGAPYPQPEKDADGNISLTARIEAVEAAVIGTGEDAAGGAENSLYSNTVDAIKAIRTSETVGDLKTATSNVSTALGTKAPIEAGDSVYVKVTRLQSAVEKANDVGNRGTDVDGIADTDSLQKRIVDVGSAICANGQITAGVGAAALDPGQTTSMAARVIEVGALISEPSPFAGLDAGKAVDNALTNGVMAAPNSLYEKMITQQKAVMTEDDGADVIDDPTTDQTITPLETRISNVQLAISTKKFVDGGDDDENFAEGSIAGAAIEVGKLLGTTGGSDPFGGTPLGDNALYAQLKKFVGDINTKLTSFEANKVIGTGYSAPTAETPLSLQAVVTALNAVTIQP